MHISMEKISDRKPWDQIASHFDHLDQHSHRTGGTCDPLIAKCQTILFPHAHIQHTQPTAISYRVCVCVCVCDGVKQSIDTSTDSHTLWDVHTHTHARTHTQTDNSCFLPNTSVTTRQQNIWLSTEATLWVFSHHRVREREVAQSRSVNISNF